MNPRVTGGETRTIPSGIKPLAPFQLSGAVSCRLAFTPVVPEDCAMVRWFSNTVD
jgi:hypothetical protein